MDNPAQESNQEAIDTPLGIDGATEVFSNIFSEPEKKEDGEAPAKEPQAPEHEAPEVDDQGEKEPPDKENDSTPKFKVRIDGKEVEVSQDELLNGYSRQQDYTKKTMELAEQRKQAEQAVAQVQQERQQYQSQLDQLAQALGQSLDEQKTIDWQQLLDSDPVQYLKQRHLYEQRQAAFGQAQAERQKLAELAQRDNHAQLQTRIQAEQQELLAKLPDWKDEVKAKAEKEQLRTFLESNGYKADEISQVVDHRAIILARKAMLFDQIIAQQKETTKKVEKLPLKVERPGVLGGNEIDGRSSAMQKLSKSGKVEDAAAVFASLLG